MTSHVNGCCRPCVFTLDKIFFLWYNVRKVWQKSVFSFRSSNKIFSVEYAMKIKKHRRGDYIITLHGHSFNLEKADRNWTLWNAKGTEINRVETKSGMLQLMREWNAEDAAKEAAHDFCYYA